MQIVKLEAKLDNSKVADKDLMLLEIKRYCLFASESVHMRAYFTLFNNLNHYYPTLNSVAVKLIYVIPQ